MTMRLPMVAGLAGLVLVLAAGCDASKLELEKTRKELATVSAERDELRTKLTAANGQVDALKKEIEDAKAKAAPDAAAAKPAAGKAAASKKKRRK
jgi:predicted  nucleic acid-binding Zn-ribbon protein